MIGLRVGPAVGGNAGPAVGVSSDEVLAGGRILVMMIGQSNAESHDPVGNLSAANTAYGTSYANVPAMSRQDWTFADDPIVWVDSGLTTLQAFQFNPTGGGLQACVGFEVSMMRDLDIARPNGFALGRAAIGGSKSTQWDPAGSYPTIPPNLFNTMVAYTNTCMATMGCSRVIFVWEQGESDAKNTTDGTNYQAWLANFIDQLRVYFPNAPFVFGKLNADATAATYLGLSQLRASQVAVAASGRANLTLVNQDSITVASGKYDGTHYTADGYVAVGHLFSPAVAAYCGIRIQPVSSFTYSPSALIVTFTDTSVSYGDTITSWLWTFGDGTTSTSQNPVKTYSGSGTYNVTLKVTNTAGDSNTSAPVAVSVISGIAGVTRDALSAWYVPASSTEWTTFLTAISSGMSTPDALWLMQEASGNPADSIGSFTLTAQNTPAYQQTVTNWTRKAITFTDGTAKRLLTTSASLPDVSTTSCLVLAYILMPNANPAGVRNMIEIGTSAATRADMQVTTAGKAQAQSTTTNSATGTATLLDGTVHLVLLEVNRTGTAVIGATDQEKLLPTFGSGMTGKNITFGATTAGNTALASGVLYACMWSGAKAEQTSTALKTLVQGLTGLTVSWS